MLEDIKLISNLEFDTLWDGSEDIVIDSDILIDIELDEDWVFVSDEELDNVICLLFVFELDGDNETLILGVFDDEFELLILGEIVVDIVFVREIVEDGVSDNDTDGDLLGDIVLDSDEVVLEVFEIDGGGVILIDGVLVLLKLDVGVFVAESLFEFVGVNDALLLDVIEDEGVFVTLFVLVAVEDFDILLDGVTDIFEDFDLLALIDCVLLWVLDIDIVENIGDLLGVIDIDGVSVTLDDGVILFVNDNVEDEVLEGELDGVFDRVTVELLDGLFEGVLDGVLVGVLDEDIEFSQAKKSYSHPTPIVQVSVEQPIPSSQKLSSRKYRHPSPILQVSVEQSIPSSQKLSSGKLSHPTPYIHVSIVQSIPSSQKLSSRK